MSPKTTHYKGAYGCKGLGLGHALELSCCGTTPYQAGYWKSKQTIKGGI